MADGIDALVHSMQPARRNPRPHRPGLQPEPDELGKRYNPMLPTGEPGNGSIRASGRFRHLYVRHRPLG